MERKFDYGEMSFLKQRKVDQALYAKYFESCDENVMTFNKWYGSDSHYNLLRVYLRKWKLKKVQMESEKAD